MKIIFNKDGSFNDELTRFLLTADDGNDYGNEGTGGTGGGGTDSDGDGTSGEGDGAGDGGAGHSGSGKGLMGSADGGGSDDGGSVAEGDVDLSGADKIGDSGRADLEAGQRPEGLGDQFWNEDTNEVRVAELAKSYNEANKQQAKLANENKELREKKGIVEKVDKAEDYLKVEGLFNDDGNLVLNDGTDRVKDVPADDPALKIFADVAQKNGLSADQFKGIATDFLGLVNEILPEPLNEEAELESLGEGGKALVQANRSWADGLLASGQINEVGHGLACAMGATAEGIKLINAFRGMSGEMSIPVGAPIEGGTIMTKEEYYDNTPGKGASAAEWQVWEKAGEELFGTAPAGTSPAGLGMPSSRSGVSSPREQKKA